MGLLAALGLPSVAAQPVPTAASASTVSESSIVLPASESAGPKSDDNVQKHRPTLEIQGELDAARQAILDRRRDDQEWVEKVTGKRLPSPNSGPSPGRRPKQTPDLGNTPSRLGRIRKALEEVMGDDKLSPDVRREAQRRLNELDAVSSAQEKGYRERAAAQAAERAKAEKIAEELARAKAREIRRGVGVGPETFDGGGKAPHTSPPGVKPGGTSSLTPKPQTGAKFSKVRQAIGKLVERGKMNAIPLGKQLAVRAPHILTGISVLSDVLDALEAVDNATNLAAHGTALPKEQAAADAIGAQSELAKADAEGATGDIELADWTLVIAEATRLRDEKGLYEMDEALALMGKVLGSSVEALQGAANDLFDRALPIKKASQEQLIELYLPAMTGAKQVNAASMHLSLTKLNNTLTAAAATYRDVAATLGWWSEQLLTLSKLANDNAWDIRVQNRADEIKAGKGISTK